MKAIHRFAIAFDAVFDIFSLFNVVETKWRRGSKIEPERRMRGRREKIRVLCLRVWRTGRRQHQLFATLCTYVDLRKKVGRVAYITRQREVSNINFEWRIRKQKSIAKRECECVHGRDRIRGSEKKRKETESEPRRVRANMKVNAAKNLTFNSKFRYNIIHIGIRTCIPSTYSKVVCVSILPSCS